MKYIFGNVRIDVWLNPYYFAFGVEDYGPHMKVLNVGMIQVVYRVRH